MKVFFGLGSNVGEKERNLIKACKELEKCGVRILKVSSLYETEPFGLKKQDWFLNCVVTGETDLSAEELLKECKKIEYKLGRVPAVYWGPRTMDIDILFYGNEIIDLPYLNVPHPGIPLRKFVLKPLAEIAPDFVHPVLKKTVQELLGQCSDDNNVIPHGGVDFYHSAA